MAEGNFGSGNDVRAPVFDHGSGTAKHSLFGNVRLEFASGHGGIGELDSQWLGQCRFTHLKADKHFASGGGAVSGDCNVDMVKVLAQLRGSAEIRQNERILTIDPDAVVIYDAGQPYEIANFSAVDVLILHIPRRLLLGQLSRARRIELRTDGLQRILRTMMETTANEIGCLDPRARESLGQAFAELVKSICQQPTSDDRSTDGADSLNFLYMRAVDYIAANIGWTDLDVGGMARKMGCSARYVYRAFEAHGTTPTACIWSLRLQAAADALGQRTFRPGLITDIAYRYGFSSSAHFSRLFRERYDCSPSQWSRLAG
jgi:AraC family transcriptional activator of tynA and feaB